MLERPALARLDGDGEFMTIDLFDNEKDGFTSVRIPAVVATEAGLVLAFAVGRTQVSDWSESKILLRRSVDEGMTWTPAQVVAEHAGRVVDNPVPIYDPQRGRIHLLYQTDYNRCYYTYTVDGGETFAPPVDITATFEAYRAQYPWTVIAPGPGHGIVLRGGRLIVPFWMARGEGKAHRPSCVATIYSDDGGATWLPGEIVVDHSPDVPNPSETVAVELGDGSVLLNIRNESLRYRRAVAVSPDGASHWSPVTFHDALYEPICAAGLVRAKVPGSVESVLVFTNPAGRPGEKPRKNSPARPRTNLTVRLSYDDGKTWPVARPIEPEQAGYSDVAAAGEYIYCLFEHGAASEKPVHPRGIRLARFTLNWVKAGKGES